MSPSPPSWQHAWDQAESRLHAIRNSIYSFPRAPPRVLRIGKLDAELLDQELLQALTDPLAKALGMIQSSYRSRFTPELTLLAHFVLYKFSVWDSGATYGAKLQNLRYNDNRPVSGRSLAPSGLPRRTLWYHAAMTVLVPYLHSRLRVYFLSRAWPDAPSSDPKRRAWVALTRVESIHSALSLASFIAFLYNGRYRSLADRLLSLRLVPSQRSSTREVSYEFMNRQMVWHAFTEFLLFLLPLINTRVLRRRIVRMFREVSLPKILPSAAKSALGISEKTVDEENTPKRRGKYWSLPEDQCAICAEDASFNINDLQRDALGPSIAAGSSSTVVPAEESSRYPIYTPYMSSCGHIYCYVCLSGRMLRVADDGEPSWECLRCGAMIFSADRVDYGDVVLTRSQTRSQSDDFQMDSVSFEIDDFASTNSD